jgi:allantoin racemase
LTAKIRNPTGQQWDAPNGWAPVQWIAVEGLATPREANLHHIRIITPCVTPNLRSAEELRALERDGIRVTHSHIRRGPMSIESQFDAAYCRADTIRSAIEAQAEGADAVIIDCMGDPALNACRERLDILVLGPGETSMHLAAMLGLRFSIVTVMDSVVPMLENLAAVYGLTGKLASVRSINLPVLEIHEDRAALQEALLSQCQRAIIDDGVHSIVLGCTGFLGCAEALSATLAASSRSVPVVDPIPTTVYVASALLSARLRPSRQTYSSGAPRGRWPSRGAHALHQPLRYHPTASPSFR